MDARCDRPRELPTALYRGIVNGAGKVTARVVVALPLRKMARFASRRAAIDKEAAIGQLLLRREDCHGAFGGHAVAPPAHREARWTHGALRAGARDSGGGNSESCIINDVVAGDSRPAGNIARLGHSAATAGGQVGGG